MLVVVALAWFTAVALLVTMVKSVLQRPKVERTMNGATALSFLGFGTKLILERR